jgi:hypothetical protein
VGFSILCVFAELIKEIHSIFIEKEIRKVRETRWCHTWKMSSSRVITSSDPMHCLDNSRFHNKGAHDLSYSSHTNPQWLDQSCMHLSYLMYCVWVLETPFRLLIGFITILHVVTTITFYTITRLHNLQLLHANLFTLSAAVLMCLSHRSHTSLTGLCTLNLTAL